MQIKSIERDISESTVHVKAASGRYPFLNATILADFLRLVYNLQ